MTKHDRPLEVTSGAPGARRMDLGTLRVSDARFAPRYEIPSHYHDRAVLSVVVEGGFLQRFPGRDCACRPGSVLIKPPEERHHDRWHDAPARHLIVEPDPSRHDELGECSSLVERIEHTFDPGSEGIARQVFWELGEARPGAALAIEALVLELLVRLLRGPRSEGRTGGPPPWVERVRELLHERFREDLRLDDLVAESGVHRSHLSRTFAAHYSLGIAAYLRRLRLESARRELAETDDPVCSIALRNRFSDQSHLTRALKAATGLPPGRYRRAHRTTSAARSRPAAG